MSRGHLLETIRRNSGFGWLLIVIPEKSWVFTLTIAAGILRVIFGTRDLPFIANVLCAIAIPGRSMKRFFPRIGAGQLVKRPVKRIVSNV